MKVISSCPHAQNPSETASPLYTNYPIHFYWQEQRNFILPGVMILLWLKVRTVLAIIFLCYNLPTELLYELMKIDKLESSYLMKRIYTPILLLMLYMSACSPIQNEEKSLKIAVLPILDALPMYVAESEGYFAQQNLSVELIPVSSAPERDQLMQSGQVDGILNELVSTMFYNREETRVVIVRFLRVATDEYPVFRILAAKESNIHTVDDLRKVPIAISEGTVIEYTTDRMLENAGISIQDIEKIAIPKIPDRLALLNSGEIEAAVLPDPLASLSVQNGARVILDDTSYPEISNSVISFSIQTVNQDPEAIERFLTALELAINDINKDKNKWNDLLTDLNLVPPPLIGSYQIPTFPTASVPSQDQFTDALNWATDKDLIQNDLSYENSVNAMFLPEQ
jgi:NitT/TauT family transport system substrate-binding protein